MPSGADVLSREARRPPGKHPRAIPVRVLAGLVAGGLLAGCSSSGQPASGGGSSAGAGAQAGPARRAAILAGPHGRIFAVQGPGGGGFVAVAVAGGSAGSGGRPKITVGPIPPTGSTRPVDLPLDTYSNVSIQQQTVLTEASTLLTQKCMTAEGFVYSAQATSSQEQALVQDTEYGFGVTSLSDASSLGYGQPAGSQGQKAGPAFLGGFASFGDLAQQPRAWTVALLGFAPGARIGGSQPAGCLTQASQELDGSGSGLSDPVPSIALQAGTWTQSDPRVLAVDAAWSRCMARQGYKYNNPEQAASASWPSSPTAAETATAVADVSCKQQVNLVNTWLTVEAAYQAALIGQDAATLTHLQASFQSMLSRAEALLSSSGQPGLRQLQPGRPLRAGVRIQISG
jgi:hypothetical protein